MWEQLLVAGGRERSERDKRKRGRRGGEEERERERESERDKRKREKEKRGGRGGGRENYFVNSASVCPVDTSPDWPCLDQECNINLFMSTSSVPKPSTSCPHSPYNRYHSQLMTTIGAP